MIEVLEILVGVPKKALRQIRARNSRVSLNSPTGLNSLKVVPRKASKLQLYKTVPQTDTGGRDEYSKALERTQEKELGKLIP